MKGVRATSWASVLAPGDGDPRHGTNGYSNLGCRCDICRDANAEYNFRRREQRARALAADQLAKPHGTESTYFNYKCRCHQCKEAHALGARLRYQRRKATTTP